MSIETLLGDIDGILEEGKRVPLSTKVMVDAEEIKRIIDDIRLNMPAEIVQAKKVASECRDILNGAEASANEIVDKARQRADLMVEEHQITKEAKEAALGIMQKAKEESSEMVSSAKARAKDIMERAEKWSGDMRKNASAYVENIIRDTDDTLTQSLNDVHKLRQGLREALSRGTADNKPNFD